MANAPRGMLAGQGPNGRAMNVFPDGRSVFATQAREQQVLNRAQTLSSPPAPTQAAMDGQRATQVAVNTAAHEVSQSQFDAVAGSLANLMNNPAQRCCLKHRAGIFPEAYQQGGPMYKLGALLSS